MDPFIAYCGLDGRACVDMDACGKIGRILGNDEEAHRRLKAEPDA